VLSLVTAPADINQSSISCKVNLTVSNELQASSSCSAPVTSKTCLRDCLGVINGSAELDRCGVCNCDGSSCLGCQSVNIQGGQLAMDSNANEMRDNVLKINRQLSVGSKNAKLKPAEIKLEASYIVQSTIQAQKDYQEVWNTIYTSIPGTVISCTASFCVNVSTASYKVEVSSGNKDLLQLAELGYLRLKNVERKAKKNKASNLKKVQSAAKKALEILKDSRQLQTETIVELSKIPANQSSCSS
jgi:hypothetical protein